MEKKTVQQIVKLLVKCYPGRIEADETMASIWHQMLHDLNDESTLAAAYHLTSISKYPPNISEIREQSVLLSDGEIVGKDPVAAWDNARRLIGGEKIDLSPEEKDALRQTGLVYDLARSTNQAADRAQFIKAYKSIMEKKRIERVTLPEVEKLAERKAFALQLPEQKETVDERPCSQQFKEDYSPVYSAPEEIRKMISESYVNDREMKVVGYSNGKIYDGGEN